MITPGEIRNKLLRRYSDFLRAWLENETLLPLNLPVGKIPETWSVFREEVDALMQKSKSHQRNGYRVETRDKNTRRFGRQQIPVLVWVDDELDFLILTGKTTEFEEFKVDCKLIRSRLPDLEHWLRENPDAVIKYHGKWLYLIDVCLYFLAHPTLDHVVREVPIPVDSKFIEQHEGILKRLLEELLPNERINSEETRFERRYGLREATTLVRLRFLNDQFRIRYGAPISDVSLPLSEVGNLDFSSERILIVENQTTFLALPTLPGTIAIFGKGFDATQLGKIEWMQRSVVFYWGDLDAQGFQILALLRRGLPQTQSLMMNIDTFHSFSTYVVPGTPTIVKDLPELSHDEMQAYRWVAERNLRLEQERVDPRYVHSLLRTVLV